MKLNIQDYLNNVTDFFIKFFKDNYNLTLNKTDIKSKIIYHNTEPRVEVDVNINVIPKDNKLTDVINSNTITYFDKEINNSLKDNNLFLYYAFVKTFKKLKLSITFDYSKLFLTNDFIYTIDITKDTKYKYIGKYIINNNTKYNDIDLNNVVTLEDIISVFKDLNNLPKVSIFNKYTKANNLIEFIKNLISIKDNVILFEFINFGILLKYKNKSYTVYIYSNNKNGIELKLIHEQETKDLILTIINQRMNIINSDLSIMDNIVIRKGKYNNLKFIKTLNNNISYTLLSLYNNVKIEKYFDYSVILKNMNIDIFNNMAVDYFKNEINNFIDNKTR